MAACEPATPTATIWAKAQEAKPACNTQSYITGNVKPAGATPKVILQRTVDGKWVDWMWKTQQTGSRIRILFGNVQSDGTYRIGFTVPGTEGATYHLRVRSEGGSVASNDVYVTPKQFPQPPYPSCD